MADLISLTALGNSDPRVDEIGKTTIVENISLSIASIALRRDFVADELPLQESLVYSTFEIRPGQWFAIGKYDLNFAKGIKEVCGARVSITDQTDAWVIFDVVAPSTMLEKLCNIDVRKVNDNTCVRTVIEYMTCFVVRLDGTFRIIGERSTAGSLHHVLTRTAKSLMT